jgi:hypothetical protein
LDNGYYLHCFFYSADTLRVQVPKRSQFSDEIAQINHLQLCLHDG